MMLWHAASCSSLTWEQFERNLPSKLLLVENSHQGNKHWIPYLDRDVFQYHLTTGPSLLEVILKFGKNSYLYDECALPSGNFPSKAPCGYAFIESFYDTRLFSWTFKVHSSFGIKVVIRDGYLQYSDFCYGNYVAVYEGGQQLESKQLGQFCGNILFEDIYTINDTCTVSISKTAVYDMFLNATYVSIIHNSAYRFNGSLFGNKSHLHYIETPHSPYLVYFKNGLIEYIWYYTFPNYMTYYRHDSSYSMILAQIKALICQDNVTFTKLTHGLWPRLLLPSQKGLFVHQCNLTNYITESVMLHRFLTVSLTANPLDDMVTFVLSFSSGQEKKIYTEDKVLRRPHPVPIYRIPGTIRPDKYGSGVGYKNIHFKTFNYKGYQRNVQHNHIHPMVNSATDKQPEFPYGNVCIMTLKHLVFKSSNPYKVVLYKYIVNSDKS